MALRHYIAPIAGAVLLSAFIGTGSAQQTQPEIGDELIVYTGGGLPDQLANEVLDGYVAHMRDTYGVDITVHLISGSAATSWVAFKTEWPNPPGDVYQFYTENVREGAEAGWWLNLEEQYTPEEWALFDQDALETMRTLGTSIPLERGIGVLIVQDNLPADAVTSWNDLGNPEFARRTTFESALSVASGYNIIAAAALTLGEDWTEWFGEDGTFNEEAARPTFEKVRDWADNTLTLTQGSGTIQPLLARGEALVSGWWWHNGAQVIRDGLPVRIVAPEEGVPGLVTTGPVVPSSTGNPVAAIEWVKYYHSAEAGVIADGIGYVGRIRLATEAPIPEWVEFQESANIVWIDDFRTLIQAPEYNQQALDFYNRIVIQGQ